MSETQKTEMTAPEKVNFILGILKRIGAWIRGDEFKKEILTKLDSLEKNLDKKIDENHMEWLRSEITLFYHRAKNGCKIYPDEFSYLSNEVFPRYEALGGNGVAHKMYDFIFDYYNNQDKE